LKKISLEISSCNYNRFLIETKFQMSRIPHDQRYLKSRMFDPVKPIRTKVREELKRLGGAPSGGTHTPRTRTALHGFPSTSSEVVYQQHRRPWRWRMTRCHVAALPRKKRKMTNCAAHRREGVEEISNVMRETEEKNTNAPITIAFASVNRTAFITNT